MNRHTKIILVVFFAFLQVQVYAGNKHGAKELKVGQRIWVGGKYLPDGIFLANKTVLKDAAEYSVLEGKTSELDSRLEILQILGFKVVLNNQTTVLNKIPGKFLWLN